MQKMKLFPIVILLICSTFSMDAQVRLSLESGLAFTQYNDVRVPNGDQAQGTLFSLIDDFESQNTAPFLRAELRYNIAKRHIVELTAAPLIAEYKNFQGQNISFAGQTFTGQNINGRYEFNTYRGSYRYRLVQREKLTFDLGASVLVRDAKIQVSQGATVADDTDLGFVPLVSFELDYRAAPRVSLLLKGDALVGPQGRAEDVFAGATFGLLKDKLALKAGYRLIEGGADVDQVYNFAFFHFADVGLVLSL